jgi:hypothetical protein
MNGRILLRTAAGLMALALLGLWVRFVFFYLLELTGNQPTPAVVFVPLLFLGMAVRAGVAAIRDEPGMLVLTGGISFVPIGLVLLFLPGFPRWIGILDLGLVAAGILLLAGERATGEEAGSDPLAG